MFWKILIISKFKGMEESSILYISLFKFLTKTSNPWVLLRAFLFLMLSRTTQFHTWNFLVEDPAPPPLHYQPILQLCKKIISNVDIN